MQYVRPSPLDAYIRVHQVVIQQEATMGALVHRALHGARVVEQLLQAHELLQAVRALADAVLEKALADLAPAPSCGAKA